jgi:hypothetical protein
MDVFAISATAGLMGGLAIFFREAAMVAVFHTNKSAAMRKGKIQTVV